MIRALGYAGFGIRDVAAWEAFSTRVLGLQISETLDDGTRVLRADAYLRRVFLHPDQPEDILYTGWETPNAEALQALRERLKAQNVPFEEGSADLARTRAVTELIEFRDPDGQRLEAFYGATVANADPFRSPAGRGPFVTGAQGLGHVVYGCTDYARMVAFYRDVLGFRISDTCDLVIPGMPVKPHVTFLHVNPRHHSLGLSALKPPGQSFIHLMLETASIDDVGFARERALNEKAYIRFDLGRHTNDHMLSFYVATPSGWMVEVGWGGLQIEDDSWHITHHTRQSQWGHRFNPPPQADQHR